MTRTRSFAEIAVEFHEQQMRFQEQRLRYQSWVHQFDQNMGKLSERRNKRQLLDRKERESSKIFRIQRFSSETSVAPSVAPPQVPTSPAKRAFTELTDEEWNLVSTVLPKTKKQGRPLADSRSLLNGILYAKALNCSWRAIPRRYAAYATCWRRYLHWTEDGTWPRIQKVLRQARYPQSDVS